MLGNRDITQWHSAWNPGAVLNTVINKHKPIYTQNMKKETKGGKKIRNEKEHLKIEMDGKENTAQSLWDSTKAEVREKYTGVKPPQSPLDVGWSHSKLNSRQFESFIIQKMAPSAEASHALKSYHVFTPSCSSSS